jgi:hypothetical protein
MTGPHSLQQSARVMAAVEREYADLAGMTRRERKANRRDNPAYLRPPVDDRSQFEREWERQNSITQMWWDRFQADLAKPVAYSPEWLAERESMERAGL